MRERERSWRCVSIQQMYKISVNISIIDTSIASLFFLLLWIAKFYSISTANSQSNRDRPNSKKRSKKSDMINISSIKWYHHYLLCTLDICQECWANDKKSRQRRRRRRRRKKSKSCLRHPCKFAQAHSNRHRFFRSKCVVFAFRYERVYYLKKKVFFVV